MFFHFLYIFMFKMILQPNSIFKQLYMKLYTFKALVGQVLTGMSIQGSLSIISGVL